MSGFPARDWSQFGQFFECIEGGVAGRPRRDHGGGDEGFGDDLTRHQRIGNGALGVGHPAHEHGGSNIGSLARRFSH